MVAAASDVLSDCDFLKELDVLDMLCDNEFDITLTQICTSLGTEFDVGNVLENDEENVQLSQIAERIENDYNESEDMLYKFDDFSPFDDIACFDIGNLDMEVDLNLLVKSENEDGDNRFRNCTTDHDMNELISDATPKNTKKSTNWAKNAFLEWRKYRNSRWDNIPDIHEFTVDDVNKWLSRFIVEVRKINGDFYPPKSLYLLSTGLLRCNRDAGVNLNFMDERDDRFLRFRKVLDSQMKNLTSKGYGVTTRQADPLSVADEMTLWEKKVIGYESSEALLNGVFFYNCKVFGMRGRDEHYNFEPSQILIGNDEKGKYIQFIEHKSKTFKGGLKQKNVENKNIKHYTNEESEQDLHELYSLYVKYSEIGQDGKFYKRPIQDSLRFSKQNLGINKLENLMKVMCNKAGLSGNFTNHSGKRTCATRMFQSGLDVQSIMSRTGHRSVQGVRKYKRPSDNQLRDISNVLEPNCKIAKVPVKPENNLATEKENRADCGASTCNVEIKSEAKSCAPFCGFQHCNITFNIGK